MELDETKIDEAVLALLFLTLDQKSHRAWKTIDYDAMNRLHHKGFIVDPGGKQKSVALTRRAKPWRDDWPGNYSVSKKYLTVGVIYPFGRRPR